MRCLTVRVALIGLITLTAVAFPRSGYAQQMSFSYYTDAAMGSDLQTLYTVISG